MKNILTRDQVRRVDKLALEEYAISGLVLMENAGRNAAAIIDRQYGPKRSAIIFCGTGNNGGDGFVIARHLHNLGWAIRVIPVGDPDRMTDDAESNFRVIQAMGLGSAVSKSPQEQQAVVDRSTQDDVIVDALLGTGFDGSVRSPLAELIECINEASKRAVIAIDVPSGLDCDTGKPCNATIRADLTVTFVAAKVGFDVGEASSFTGGVEVADIGAPPEIIERILSSKRSSHVD